MNTSAEVPDTRGIVKDNKGGHPVTVRTSLGVSLPGMALFDLPTPSERVPGHAALLVLTAAILLGCTVIRTRTIEKGDVTMTEEQFAAHVEHVFRYHNRVMNDLISHSDGMSEDSDDSRAVSAAEATMDRACEPLNEVVAAESFSQDAGFQTKSRLPQAVPECEAATQQLEVLLLEVFKAKGISTNLVAH